MITNNDIRRYLSLPSSDKNIEVLQVDKLSHVDENTLMFINKSDIYVEGYASANSCVFLIDDSYPDIESDTSDFIRVSNPKYKFCKIVEKFRFPSVLQNSYVEKYIGERCKIDPGVIIGGEDFSPVLTDDNRLVQFPQMGGVFIRDDVVIKYNTMIGKGTFGYTEIGNNTMIDFGCQIGHNCIVGESCIIAAGTIIGGSTTIGDHTTIGIGAKIRNGLHIGNNVSIGMGSIVIRDIPDDCVVVGNPARIIEHKRIFSEEGLL